MADRSGRGSGQPVECPGRRCPQNRVGPDPRKPSGPAVKSTAQTGRTQDRSRHAPSDQKILANREPSTQDVGGRKADLSVLRPLSRRKWTSLRRTLTSASDPLRTFARMFRQFRRRDSQQVLQFNQSVIRVRPFACRRGNAAWRVQYREPVARSRRSIRSAVFPATGP